jgi:hypothetical protein
VRMMRSRLVGIRLVMPRGFPVVSRCVLVMLRCFVVMMRRFLGHVSSYPGGVPEELHYRGGMLGGDC